MKMFSWIKSFFYKKSLITKDFSFLYQIKDESELLKKIKDENIEISDYYALKILKYNSLSLFDSLIRENLWNNFEYDNGSEDLLFTAISTNDIDKIKYVQSKVKRRFINIDGDNAILYAAKKAQSAKQLFEMLKVLDSEKFNWVNYKKENLLSITLDTYWFRTEFDYILFTYILDRTTVRFVKFDGDIIPVWIYLQHYSKYNRIDPSLKNFLIKKMLEKSNFYQLCCDLNIPISKNIPNKDQWRIMSQKKICLFDIKTLEVFSTIFYKRKSKAYKRFITSGLIKDQKINYDLLITTSFFKDLVDDDNHFIDYVINKGEDISNSDFMQYLTSCDYDNLKLLRSLVNNLGLKRFYSLFIINNFSKYYYVDVLYKYNRIVQTGKKVHFAWKNISSLIDLDNKMQREIDKFKSEEFKLNQTNIEYLDGLEYNVSYSYYVPKTNIELINCGLLLNFCIGNGNYAKEVFNSKNKRIVFLMKNEKIEGAIYFNIDTLHIIEAKVKNNRRMDSGYIYFVEKAITKHYSKLNIKVKPMKKEILPFIGDLF